MICAKTLKRYCCEDVSLIENYKLAIADSKTWHCHHRRETDENLTNKQLIRMGLYYDRPASELIFLPPSEHISSHQKGCVPWNKGVLGTDEFRKKMSEVTKGEKNPFYGKHHTEETKRKISEANKGRQKSEETIRKIVAAHIGKPLSSKHKQKLSEIAKERFSDPTKTPTYNKPWYNNGLQEAHYYEGKQPNGWVRGRLKRKSKVLPKNQNCAVK